MEFQHEKAPNEPFFSVIRDKFNQSQLNAIRNICLSSNRISLLQGPVKGNFLLLNYNSLGQGKPIRLLEQSLEYFKQFKTFQKEPNVILWQLFDLNFNSKEQVCAPSNAAIDQVILRIQKNGIFKRNGKTFQPKVVRVGILEKQTHNLVKMCNLDEIVSLEMNKTRDGFMVIATLHWT